MQNIIQNLIQLSLYSTALMLAVIVIRLIFNKKIKAIYFTSLWLLVLIRLLVPITIETGIHIGNFIKTKQPTETVIQDTALNEINITPMATNINVADIDTTQGISVENKKSFFESINYYLVAFVIWILGTIITLSINRIKYRLYLNKLKKSKLLYSKKISKHCHIIKSKLKIRKSVNLAISKSIDIPITFGVFKSKILLPFHLVEKYNDDKIKLVLTHELCHIKRMDSLRNTMWLIAKSFHWFNPLVWISYRKSLIDAELACDDMVIEASDSNAKARYSECLLDAAKLSPSKFIDDGAMAFCKDSSLLGDRIKRIIKPSLNSGFARLTIIIISIMVILACFTTACIPSDNTADTDVIKETETMQEEMPLQEDQVDVIKQETAQNENGFKSSGEYKQASSQYRLTDSESFEMVSIGKYYGDWIAVFKVDDGQTTVQLLNSDMSLVSLKSAEFEKIVPVMLGEEELRQKVEEYLGKYYPNISKEVMQEQRFDLVEGCYTELIVENEDGEQQYIAMALNGQGKLFFTNITPDVDTSKPIGDIIELEIKAREYVLAKQAFVSADKLQFSSQDETSQENNFIYDYFSENPSIDDYSFSAAVFVSEASGEVVEMVIHPIFGEKDTLVWSDVEKMSAEYISKSYDVDKDILFFNGFFFTFEYDVLAYRATLFDEAEKKKYIVDIDASGAMLYMTQSDATFLG